MAAAAIVAALQGCGGGSGGGGTSAVLPLSVPSQMTVIAARDPGTGAMRIVPERWQGQGDAQTAAGTLAAGGTDYENDATRIYVDDESMEPLAVINEILAMLDQTGYADPAVLNAGPYIALVDEARASSRGSDPTNGGQTAQGATEVRFMEWVVRSDRADAASPHVVQFWIDWHEDSADPDKQNARLYGKLTIFEAPSDALPYGRFELHYKMLPAAAPPDSTAVIMRGTLATVARGDGMAEYTFYEAQGDMTQQPADGQQASLTRARVVTGVAGTSGSAFSARSAKWNFGGTVQEESFAYHLAFNEGYMARRKVHGSETVEAFDRNDFDVYPWQYGLYGATSEARVQLASGFPVKTEGGARGYAGYHGLWFPDDVTITHDMPVTRESFGAPGSAEPESFKVFVAAGRLEKRTRTVSTLGNLRGEGLYWWDQTTQNNVEVQWTGSDLLKVAELDRGSGQWAPVEPPVSILGNFQPNAWVSLHSPARGEVNFGWPSSGNPTDATPVAIWEVTTINADSPEMASGDLALHGWFRMLRPQLTQNQVGWTGGESPYFPDATNPGEGKQYLLSKQTLLLSLDGQDVVPAAGVVLAGTASEGGLVSGPLLTAAISDLGQMHEQDVTYQWQTGQRSWNQLRTLVRQNGSFVTFDAPLAFTYVHDEPTNTRFHGKSFRLEYQGPGQLQGVPFEQAAGSDRWYPVFAIPSGTLLTNAAGSYKVKVLEAEQRMRAVANAQQVIQQEGLDVTTELTPPADTWQEPGLGVKPTVTDPPRYVAGDKQDDG